MFDVGVTAVLHVLFLGLLPPVVLIIAAIYVFVATRHYAGGILLLGAVLILLSSMNVFYHLFLSFYFPPDQVARYAIYGGFVFGGLNGIGLVLIAVGLIIIAGAIREARRRRAAQTAQSDRSRYSR